MTKQQYLEICSYLAQIIAGTQWEGHVFVVGGAVRSFVMEDNIKDVDVVVDLPEGGIRFGRWIKEQGYTTHALVEYPTYGVTMFRLDKFPEEAIECVYTRCEKYPDRSTRNPETEFGTLEEDCFRRDLTINALYYDVSRGKVLDLTGNGLNDIKDKVIRVTNNPDIIFDDDPLRILRAVRFASRFGWNIEQTTLEGMKRNAYRIPMLSQERITDEVNKMLQCPNPGMAMRMLLEIGALQYVLPEFMPAVSMTQNKYHDSTVWEHTLNVLDKVQSNELEVRLSALFHDIGKIRVRKEDEDGSVHFIDHELESARMAEVILRRMKYPLSIIKQVKFLAKNHMRMKNYGDNLSNMRPKKLRKFLFNCGDEKTFRRLCELIHADNTSHAEEFNIPNQVPKLKELAKAETRMFNYRLPINGHDVMENLPVSKPQDIKAYLEHAQTLAFAHPDYTKEEMLHDLKFFNPSKQK